MNQNTQCDTQTDLTVSFIGLGAMGYPMASHLTKVAKKVQVWNRTQSKAQEHVQSFATHAVSLADAFDADIIFSCLPTSAEVESIIDSEDSHTLKAGTIWVDCTSGVPASAQKLAKKLAKKGCYFLDAPVSGQTIGAKNGTLTVMIGGDADAFYRAKPIISSFGGLIKHVGNSGAGFAVKAVNNALLAVNLWSAGEGLSILKSHGVDLSNALACINASSGQSLASSNIIPNRVLTRDFPNTFAIDLLAKDCAIATDLQQQTSIPAPIIAQIASLVRASSNQHDKGTADFSELIQFLESFTGIEVS